MAIGREIKHKIKSTQNMRKVTRALEMVSASKIRKAQDLMQASRPYARMMRQVIAHLAHATPEYHHPFLMETPEVRNVGFIVVSTDRGQCGGLNSNLFRKVLPEISRWRDQGVGVDVVAIGQKAVQLFRRTKGVNLVASVTKLGDRPRVERLVGVIKVMLDAYREGQLQRVFLVYNDFVNSMTQKPHVDALLPLPVMARELEAPVDDATRPVVPQDIKRAHNWDYLYEPEPQVVLKFVLTRYVESLVYQATLENLASEHAARRIAMKNASDNANKVIETLMLSYNKARQAAITQEISEIVGGAAAV